MISSLLVANRGEIARRIFHSCRALGIGTVAVYSDADEHSPHVTEADAAVRLPGNAPAETYLRVELIIAAAHSAGADAIHPGYGFLSENADFARAVLAAGLTWIGPPPDAIAQMGSKIESKRLMAAAGVPVLADLDPRTVTEADLPVIVKASAGGGGRGMRIVRSLAELPAEIAAARSEAASAFGNPTVFCEPYVETGHHVEVQVLADQHGAVWAVGERECSIQRRHQKVLEEAPSPLVERCDGMREQLFAASIKAAEAIGYVGAGTVEFLADDAGRFFFLEMNTRLQVEHPVTESTTGLDLVRQQIRVADGRRLPLEQPSSQGHSIEVRLYAEDPAEGWQPQSGRIHRIWIPGIDTEFRPASSYGLRLDSGVVDGSVVGVHYDPLLAKVISWAESRDEAASRLAGALAGAQLHGLSTNRDLLVRVLRHPAFLAGDTVTAFFDRHDLVALSEPLADSNAIALAVLAGALAEAAANRARATVGGQLPSGWRNVFSQPQRKRYLVAGETHEVSYRLERGRLSLTGQDGVSLLSCTPEQTVLLVDGVRRSFTVSAYQDLLCVDSRLGSVTLTPLARFGDSSAELAPGSLTAPMPGRIARLAVGIGDSVVQGQPLLWLEAMKMEHTIAAPATGTVTELPVALDQQVEVGAVLAVIGLEEGE